MTLQSSPQFLRLAVATSLAGALLLTGCSGASDSENGGSADGFSVMVAQSNDGDQAYAEILEVFAEERDVDIEVIPYPSDAYFTQVAAQLQAGNAADVMILAPGTGQPMSVVLLAEAGLLAPLADASAATIPANSEDQYQVDGKTYAQPTSLVPAGLAFNADAAAEAGISEYPETYDELLSACEVARDAGRSFTVLAGSVPFNNGYLAQIVSATRVYEAEPDWNTRRAKGEVTFAESDGWRETLEDIMKMSSAGCFQDGAAGGTFDSITAGLVDGSSLTAALPGSATNSITASSGSELTVRSFPPASGQAPFLLASANYAWAVNAEVDNAKMALIQDFLDWVATPEHAKSFADSYGAVPITGAEGDDIAPLYREVAGLFSSGSYVGLPNATWPNAAVYDKLGTGVQGLLTGQMTVDQVLADMDSAWG